MEEFVPGQVYENLVKMIEYRGAKLSAKPLTIENVAQNLNHYEFVSLVGTRGSGDVRPPTTIVVTLLAPGSNYALKSGDFKKLLKGLPKMSKGGDRLEAIFISDRVLTTHIKKQIIMYKSQNPNISIEDYDYSMFMIEAPKHESVPKHTIMTESEIETFCNMYNTTRDKFPKIMQSDIQAVWLGLHIGMVVRINRISETAGSAIAYRVCVKG